MCKFVACRTQMDSSIPKTLVKWIFIIGFAPPLQDNAPPMQAKLCTSHPGLRLTSFCSFLADRCKGKTLNMLRITPTWRNIGNKNREQQSKFLTCYYLVNVSSLSITNNRGSQLYKSNANTILHITALEEKKADNPKPLLLGDSPAPSGNHPASGHQNCQQPTPDRQSAQSSSSSRTW